MTVKELIEALQRQPQTAQVWLGQAQGADLAASVVLRLGGRVTIYPDDEEGAE